jgi:hypothetical protein
MTEKARENRRAARFARRAEEGRRTEDWGRFLLSSFSVQFSSAFRANVLHFFALFAFFTAVRRTG